MLVWKMRRRALHAALPHREFAKLGVYFAMSRKEYALFLQLALRIFSFHLKMKTALEDEKYFPDGFTLETRWKLLLQIKLFSDFFCILTIFADNLEMFCSDEMLNKLTQLHEFFDINFIVILSKNVFFIYKLSSLLSLFDTLGHWVVRSVCQEQTSTQDYRSEGAQLHKPLKCLTIFLNLFYKII